MAKRAYECAANRGLVMGVALASCAWVLLLSCQRHKPRETALAPLTADAWLIDLDVPGFGKAAVAVPLAATAPRPIVIALHGSADRPEWICGALRSIAGPQPFVLCPRGVLRADLPAGDARFTFGSADDAARELRAALAALKRRFGTHVARGPLVFVGLQIGADHAAYIARQEPAFFSRLLLIGPEPSTWPPSQAAMFGRAGGQRVLFAFAAGQSSAFEQKAVLTVRGGAEARAIAFGEGPLSLDPATRGLLAKHWSWLAAKPSKPPSIDNVAGNPLSVSGPTGDR